MLLHTCRVTDGQMPCNGSAQEWGMSSALANPNILNYDVCQSSLSKTTSHVDEHVLSFTYYPSYIMSWINLVKAVLCHNQLANRVLLILPVAYHTGLFFDHFYSYHS